MIIDITIIDKYTINKNKQFRPFDETACKLLFLSKKAGGVTACA